MSDTMSMSEAEVDKSAEEATAKAEVLPDEGRRSGRRKRNKKNAIERAVVLMLAVLVLQIRPEHILICRELEEHGQFKNFLLKCITYNLILVL